MITSSNRNVCVIKKQLIEFSCKVKQKHTFQFEMYVVQKTNEHDTNKFKRNTYLRLNIVNN